MEAFRNFLTAMVAQFGIITGATLEMARMLAKHQGIDFKVYSPKHAFAVARRCGFEFWYGAFLGMVMWLLQRYKGLPTFIYAIDVLALILLLANLRELMNESRPSNDEDAAFVSGRIIKRLGYCGYAYFILIGGVGAINTHMMVLTPLAMLIHVYVSAHVTLWWLKHIKLEWETPWEYTGMYKPLPGTDSTTRTRE